MRKGGLWIWVRDRRVLDDIRRRQLVNDGEKMELEQARRTQFAARIGQLKAVETELENCERILEKLRSIEDGYMRIMRERCIGPYSPWLAALDGEYEYLSESSDDEALCSESSDDRPRLSPVVMRPRLSSDARGVSFYSWTKHEDEGLQ